VRQGSHRVGRGRAGGADPGDRVAIDSATWGVHLEQALPIRRAGRAVCSPV